VPDAAALLGISLSAAKARLHRAMTALRRVLTVDAIEIRIAERGTMP
jgi:DNA-directed RNA polymerase specialized sigma24 family protein